MPKLGQKAQGHGSTSENVPVVGGREEASTILCQTERSDAVRVAFVSLDQGALTVEEPDELVGGSCDAA